MIGGFSRRTGIDAPHRLFFPAAAIYGACLPLLSLWAMLGQGIPPGLAGAAGHAHEMLFGFALAVVAGYTLGPQARWRLGLAALSWLLAWVTALFWPGAGFTAVFNLAFPVFLAWHVIPRFATRAKKWRNRALAPLLSVLCLMAVIAGLAPALGWYRWLRTSEFEAILFFTLLMLFMGGRMIAPAAAGEIQRQGGLLEARVQPRIEGALLLTTALAALVMPFSPPLAALVLLIISILAAVRLLRWRLWLCRRRPDLIWLGLGYGWLPVGLVLLAAGLMGWLHPLVGIHALAVGALGTLTLTVMGRTRLLRLRREPGRSRVLGLAVSLVTLAAILRLTAAICWQFQAWHYACLWGSAWAWALAFLLLAGGLLCWRRQ